MMAGLPPTEEEIKMSSISESKSEWEKAREKELKDRITWLTELSGNITFPKKQELSRLANFILIDIRLIFIIVSVYVTIITAITSTANNEAADDTDGNRTFALTSRPEHRTMVQISGVSNAVLWNCREKSVTNQYYKVLYGLLFTMFVMIMLVFMITRLSVLIGNIHQKSNQLNYVLWHLQLLKYLRSKYQKKNKRGPKEIKVTDRMLTWFSTEWNTKHFDDDSTTTTDDKSKDKHPNIHFSVLLFPFFEALFLIIALPFMLTTYDINPIGCLVGPNEGAIEYNNATGNVQLQFTESVLSYQQIALTISILLMIPIVFFVILLPVQYFRITKRMAKEISKIFEDTQKH